MTGYDLSRFVDLTEDQKNEMLCGICLAILKSPVDTICGHTFCCNCINEWLNQYNESCPQCRHYLSPIFFNSKPYIDSTKRFRNLIEKLRIKCDFADKGCEEVLELGLLRKHLQKCQFNEFKNGPQLEWIPMKGNETPRPEAVIGGYDINGESIYVGRAFQCNDLIVGKIVPSHKCCYVSYDGREIAHKHFESLINPRNTELKWVFTSHASIPLGAIAGGKQANGEVVYIGRAKYSNSLVIGKVIPSQQVLSIPFGGAEHKLSRYEVLCFDIS